MRITGKMFLVCIPGFLVGCRQATSTVAANKTGGSHVQVDQWLKSGIMLPQDKYLTPTMRSQMASRKFSSLNKYVGKYEYCDARGRLTAAQDFLGIELMPDGTYDRDTGKGGSHGKYSIKKDTLFLHDYSWRRRTARAKLSGNILTIYDKSEYKGSVKLVKTWPIKGIHYQLQTRQ